MKNLVTVGCHMKKVENAKDGVERPYGIKDLAVQAGPFIYVFIDK